MPTVSKGFQVKMNHGEYVGEEVMALNMRRPDNSIDVEFAPERIDITSNVADYTWENLMSAASDIQNKLVSKLNVKISRLALGTNIRYVMSEDIIRSAYNKIVSSEGDGDLPVEWIIRKALRSLLSLDNNVSVTTNKAYTLSKPDLSTDFLNLELDFNTVVDSDIAAITLHRMSILNEFLKFIKSDIEKYRNLFESWNL